MTASSDLPQVPTGRRWRERWRELENDEREFIADVVGAGDALPDPGRAALAVTFANRSLRDVVGAVVIGPAAALLSVFVGAAAGRVTRGDGAVATFVRIVTWRSGVPWVVAVVVLTGLAYLVARRRIALLREGRRANREVLRTASRVRRVEGIEDG